MMTDLITTVSHMVLKERVKEDVTQVKENIDKEKTTKENIDKEDTTKENIDKEDTTKENIAEENIVKEDIVKDNIAEENEQEAKASGDGPVKTKYVIRRGQIKDCSQISVLMRKLAESEDYGDRVEVSEEDLRRDGFGDYPVFESIVLEDREANEESSILGYALYFMGFCSWKGRLLYLEDVYINSEYRGTGLGIALLHAIAQISEERGCKAIQGTVVKWNTDVMKLYKRIGARDMTENEKYHLVAIGKADVQRFAQTKLPMFNNGSQIVSCELYL